MMYAVETLDMTSVIEQAGELADMVNQSSEVSDYLYAKKRMREDQEVSRLQAVFQKKKQQYEEVQRFGKYHPDFDKVTAEVRELKRSLEMLDSVQVFKKAEAKLDEMLYQISRALADAVSPSIKVPSNNPFLEAISSGCGSGGGSCGCSTKAKKMA